MRVKSGMMGNLLVFSFGGVERVVPSGGQRTPLWSLGLLKEKYDNPKVRFLGEDSEQVVGLGVVAVNWRRVSGIEWTTRNNPGWWNCDQCQTVEEKKESGFYFIELCEQLLHRFYWEVGVRYCGYQRFDVECVLGDGNGWIIEKELEYIRVYCEKVGIFNLGCVISKGLELELAIEAVGVDCIERERECAGGPDVGDPRVISYLMDRYLHSELYNDYD